MFGAGRSVEEGGAADGAAGARCFGEVDQRKGSPQEDTQTGANEPLAPESDGNQREPKGGDECQDPRDMNEGKETEMAGGPMGWRTMSDARSLMPNELRSNKISKKLELSYLVVYWTG